MLFGSPSLLVFLGALLLSALLYLKNIKAHIVPVANMCSLLSFIVSLIYVINVLGNGLEDPSRLAGMLATTLLMNLYAGIFNVAARVFDRFANVKATDAAERKMFSRGTRRISTRHAFR